MDKLLGLIQQDLGVLCGDTAENFGQCVGLIELWLDNLGLNDPHLFGNAKDLLNNANSKKFDIIQNDINNPNQYPFPGDILVYGSSWGAGYGHTGVVLFADGKSIILFEQNNPGVPTIKRETYNGLLGWLHPKNFYWNNALELSQCNFDRDNNWNITLAVADKLGVTPRPDNKDQFKNDLLQKIDNLNLLIKNANGTIVDLKDNNDELKRQISILQNQVTDSISNQNGTQTASNNTPNQPDVPSQVSNSGVNSNPLITVFQAFFRWLRGN